MVIRLLSSIHNGIIVDLVRGVFFVEYAFSNFLSSFNAGEFPWIYMYRWASHDSSRESKQPILFFLEKGMAHRDFTVLSLFFFLHVFPIEV